MQGQIGQCLSFSVREHGVQRPQKGVYYNALSNAKDKTGTIYPPTNSAEIERCSWVFRMARANNLAVESTLILGEV